MGNDKNKMNNNTNIYDIGSLQKFNYFPCKKGE